MTESRGAALEPGAHVGRYVVLERIGRGRVFECFRARAFGVEGFEKDVALKIPLPDLAADAERLRALLAAIKVSTTLSHANVVQVIDLGESPEGVPFFVSELARGRPLSRLTGLDAGAGVPLGGALAIAVEIAKALDHGERRKPTAIRHGALDLAQVFVTSDAIVKVSDFGVAAAVGLGGAATSDLAALARMIRELAPVSSQGAAPLLDALEGGALADAAAAHEALLERWFETPPEERDLAGWLASHEHVASDATTATATTMATATAATATEPTPTPAPAITEPSVEPSRREPPPPRDSSSAAGFKFVGRAVELRDLGQVLAAAARNGMSRLTLHGPPGVGKTRLTREFVRRVRDHALTAFVSCAAPGAEQPLGALARTLATLLGLDALQPNGALAAADPDRWVVALRALGLDLDEVRAVAGAAGVRVEAIGPRGRPPSLHEAVIHVLESARLGRPILLAYDDADLLDPVTASVLDALATSERARSLPVLLLQVSAAAPPAEQPAFAVGELDDDDVAQLLAARLGARVLEPRLFDGLVERCGGHPAHLESAVRALLDRAAIVVASGVADLASARELEDLALPERSSPIAALDASTLAVLAAATFFPAGASRDALARVAALDSDAASNAATALVSQGLARFDAEGDLFAAALYRSPALEALGPDAASSLTGRAARIAAIATCDEACELEAQGRVDAALELFARALPDLDDAARARAALDAITRLAAGGRVGPQLARHDLSAGLGRALELVGVSQETSALRIELARALLASGAAFLAQGIITGVLDDPTLDASVTSALELELALASGDPARVTDLLGSLDASKLTSSARADAAELCLMSGDVARAELFAAGARLATDAALAQRVRRLDADILAARDTPLAVVDAAFDLAIAMARAGDLDAALARTALAGALATASRPSPVDSPHVGARPFALATEARDAAKRAADDVLLELASAWRDVFADVTSAADWAAHERARARAAASGHAAHALALELAAAVGRKDATALTSLGERCDREGRGDLATLARRFAAITIR